MKKKLVDLKNKQTLAVLLHILQRKGIINIADLEDMNDGVFRFNY